MDQKFEGADETFGLEVFATVAAVKALSDQLREKETDSYLANNAAAGALIGAPSRAPVALALIGSLWGCVAQQFASCWADRVLPEANPANAPRWNRPFFGEPGNSAN